MDKKVKVIKRDGSLEDFNPNKIAKILRVAGLNAELIQPVSNKVDVWVKSLNQDSISSLKIRDKVLEELKLVDQYIADLFQWYEKTKEIKRH